MQRLKMLLVAGLGFAALPAAAQVDFYAGANLGVTDYDFTEEGAVSLAGSFGIYMTPYLSLELSALDLGELDEYVDSDETFYTSETLTVQGVNLALRAVAPIDEVVELYGKVGLFLWRAQVEEDEYDIFKVADGQNLSAGLGVTWLLSPNFGLNLEWQRFDLEDTYASNASVGVRFEF